MDFLKSFDVGNLITILTLLGTLILGWSDISRRRAESKKLETDSDTKLMSEIKQASIDLVNQLRGENGYLTQDITELKSRVSDCEFKIRCYKNVLKERGVEVDPCDETPTRQV